MKYPLFAALAICLLAALLEGLLSGKEPRQRFKQLRLPRFSPPFWAWILFGAFYYLLCFGILYRIFISPVTTSGWIALLILLGLMSLNAAWNWVFFRAKNLLLSFIAFIPYGALALLLFVFLLRFDRVSAWFVSPYLGYLIYATFWGYKLWKLNGPMSEPSDRSVI